MFTTFMQQKDSIEANLLALASTLEPILSDNPRMLVSILVAWCVHTGFILVSCVLGLSCLYLVYL